MTNIWVPPRSIQFPPEQANPFVGVPTPVFHVIFGDNGDGSCNITPYILTDNVANPTTSSFTRFSTAWTRLQSGLWKELPINTPRHYYGVTEGGTFSGRSDGLLTECVKTNSCLYARDMTQANWVKAGITAAKDQIGIDGVSNSASSITATAPNGTILQNTGLANGWYSAFARRITGTGTLEMTVDGGGTWTAVTSQVDTYGGNWMPLPFDGIFGVAAGNVGFRVGTNGDKFAVDMNQHENSPLGGPTSPIPTTNIAVTRASESLQYTGAPSNIFTTPASMTMFGVHTSPFNTLFGGGSMFGCFVDVNNRFYVRAADSSSFVEFVHYEGGILHRKAITGLTIPVRGTPRYVAAMNSSAVGMNLFADGRYANASTLPNPMPFTVTNPFLVGGLEPSQQISANTIKNLQVFNSVLDQYELDSLVSTYVTQ